MHPSRTRRLAPALGLLSTLLGGTPAPAEPLEPPALPGQSRIGVTVQSMTPELRRHFQAPEDRGLLVTRVAPDRPAARAGLKVGDVILEAGGEVQRRSYDLVRVVGRAEQGTPLRLQVLRGGKTRTIDVIPEGTAAPWPDPGAWAEWLERNLQMGSEELREQLERLEERLEELERRLDEQRQPPDGAERT